VYSIQFAIRIWVECTCLYLFIQCVGFMFYLFCIGLLCSIFFIPFLHPTHSIHMHSYSLPLTFLILLHVRERRRVVVVACRLIHSHVYHMNHPPLQLLLITSSTYYGSLIDEPEYTHTTLIRLFMRSLYSSRE